MSDVQRSQPPRRDFRRGGGGGFNRGGGGFRRDRPAPSAFERGGGTVAIKVKLADEDVGRFIGKAGRNIEALRTLVRVASSRDRKRVFVDLANAPITGQSFSPRGGGRRPSGEVTA
ncbi:MAG: KH domain-containing protein [Chloroflexi bacterium]|nr:MAG: KH domain-containing protein [Chloroflexota bacterium]